MQTYRDFKEYMEDNYLDMIMDRLSSYVIRNKDVFENDEIYEVKWVDLSDACVCGVTFKDIGNDWIEIRLSVDGEVEIKARTRYGIESFAETKTYNVFCKAVLNKGLHNLSITEITDYNKNQFDRNKSLSQNLVPYMYEEDVEKHAEDFLKRNYSKALLQPMPLPVEEIADKMGMKIFYAPLENSIFGKTYFDEDVVTVYSDITGREKLKITTDRKSGSAGMPRP